MSAPSSDDAPRRGSLRAVPYSQLPPRATLPPRKGKTKGLTKGQGKSKDQRPGSATTQRTSASTAVPRELHGQQVNITPAGIPTQMLSNEKIPSEPRLLVLARHRAQQHKPKSADSQFRRQARRPSKWQREGQPNKYLQEDGGQRTDRPSASSSTAKRTLDGLSPPPPPKHRDLVRLPCLLTPPLPRLHQFFHLSVRKPLATLFLLLRLLLPLPPSLSLSFLLLPPSGRPIPTQAILSGLWSVPGSAGEAAHAVLLRCSAPTASRPEPTEWE